MLIALKFGIALPRVRTPQYDRWASAEEVFAAATTAGAEALGRKGELGRIAPGYRADFVLYRRDSVSLSPLNDPVRQLVHSESGSGIDTVVVDGETAMRGGMLVRVDEVRLVREFRSAYEELAPAIVDSERASRALLEGIERVYRKALTVPVAPETMKALVDYNAGEGYA